MATKKFKTEVSQLLNLIIHSLYSHKEVFLRELVSNASDALDKLKYLTLTDDALKKLKFDPRVDITFSDNEKKTLTISDNGIGMNDKDLEENLGTIARSGTKNFLTSMTGDAKKDSNLIGQFGVGFYSCFMVAEKVEVITRKAGEDAAWSWTSDGVSNYSVKQAERESQGTTVILQLNEEGAEFASQWQIRNLDEKYSNHIPFGIFMTFDDVKYEGEGDDRKEKRETKTEQINNASALWQRPKSELTEDDYNEFYKSLSHDPDEPLHYLHTRAEGTQEYTTLFYIPKKAPMDMLQADYKSGVKLYVRRVFITDDAKELMPTYLRFLRGIIDSEDLPLNVSREILQQNKIMNNIRSASVKKVLSELQKLAQNNPEKYTEFIKEFNRPIKEGLYSDFANRETLMELVRFKSTTQEGFTSLAGYVERMKTDQKSIYYITGGSEQTLRNSPLLELFKKKDMEVLIMDEEIDELVVPMLGLYKEKEFQAVNRSGADDELKSDEDKKKQEDLKPLLKKIKEALGERVKDVTASVRLADSPACIVVDKDDPTMQMRQMMKALGQKEIPDVVPILEVNPDHEIITRMKNSDDADLIADMSAVLLDQSLLAEGVMIKQPAEFVKKLNRLLAR